MTVIRPNSIAGINSITVQSGQALNIHDATGNIIRNITNSSGVSTFSSLHVGSGTTTSNQGISVGTGASIVSDAVNTLDVYTNNSNRLRIASTGNLLVGATAVEDWDGSRSHRIQVTGNTYQTAGISILDTQNDDNPCELLLGKSRSTGNTIVGSADDVGQIRFAANDGAGFHSIAWIRSSMDGTPGDGDLPSNLRFGTSADGGTTVSERLRIDSSGRLGIQGAASRGLLEVRASGGSNTMLTAVFGANEGTTAGTLSDNTDKACRMGIQHYDTDALPFGLLVGSAGASSNSLNFGGGTSLMNAATQIQFTTAANTTTTSGSERFRIASAGQLGIGGANYGTAGQVLTSGGASAAPSWAAAGGITMAEHWRLTGDVQGNADPLGSWEAADNGFAGNLGSSMSHSGGTFTYPSTGIYYVMFTLVGYSDNHTQNVIGFMKHTTNNSSYSEVAYGLNGIYDYNNSYPSWATATCHYIFDITDTSQQKTRFCYGAGQGGEYAKGSSTVSYTSVTFIRLGDT